jgi:acetyl esterase/lipase
MKGSKTNFKIFFTLVILLGLSFLVFSQQVNKPYLHLPTTISQEARQILRMLPNPDLRLELPKPNEVEKWKVVQKAAEERNLEMQKALINFLQPTVTKRVFGGVNILDIRPKGWEENGKVLVYTHGGAYTLLSAASTLASSALVAERTGIRVISVDYTLAPHSKWQQTIGQVIAVFNELKKQGYAMGDIAIYGDSAGGGLAAGVVLKMRDEGMGMPAAVVLWSPWADITETGDTYVTLKLAEPMYTYKKHMKNSADAYAVPKDQKNPYVSPVYGDFTKGFPPTLIQGGTKEIFLSNFIRLYQALDLSGRMVKLDLYEGMPHVFQSLIPNSPESKMALTKVDAFLKRHMRE